MNFLFAAFFAVWLLVTVYIVYMTLRQRRIEQELAVLEETMQERMAKASAAAASLK